MAVQRLALVAACLILAACDSPAETPSPSAPQTSPAAVAVLTMTDGECALRGDMAFPDGELSLHVVNDSPDMANIEVLNAMAGHTFTDIADLFTQVQAALDADQALPPPPDWLIEWARVEVDAGSEADLRRPLPAGTYAVLCGQIRLPGSLLRVFLLGPIDVTE